MEDEFFVLERFLAPGIFELVSPIYFTNKIDAEAEMKKYIEAMKKFNKKCKLRITKLSKYNIC